MWTLHICDRFCGFIVSTIKNICLNLSARLCVYRAIVQNVRERSFKEVSEVSKTDVQSHCCLSVTDQLTQREKKREFTLVLDLSCKSRTRGHSAERIPTPCCIEIGTEPLPASRLCVCLSEVDQQPIVYIDREYVASSFEVR